MTIASPPRILEIGRFPFFKAALPETTVFVSTSPDRDHNVSSEGYGALSLAQLRRVWRMAHQPGFDLICCRPPALAPWSARWLSRSVMSRRMLSGDPPFVRAFGSQLLRGRLSAPLVIIDQEDTPYIDRHNFHLIDACRFYFKRELPVDHWRVFQRTGHRGLPTPRFRRLARYRRRVAKLRPISLGLPLASEALLPATPRAKTVDVFFAGEFADSSTVRTRGLQELVALRDRGVTVDIADGRLPLDEFYARMARARLVWSPEGLGWDCFRHYETAACFSVPVISRPTIERHRPLIDGQHAFYYDVEPGGLTSAILAGLEGAFSLDLMARAGRAHVLAHHTPRALAAYVVETALGPVRQDEEAKPPVVR